MKRPGSYQIQAAIAAVHAEAATAADTDWPKIALLYDELLRYEPTPVVELNRAVAVSFAANPDLGLRLLERIERTGVLETTHPSSLPAPTCSAGSAATTKPARATGVRCRSPKTNRFVVSSNRGCGPSVHSLRRSSISVASDQPG